MNIKCIAEREMFNNGNYRIIACSPTQAYEGLKLSKYNNFTIKGGDIPYITIGKEYELIIEELATDKYGTSYKVLSCPSIDELDFHNLSREESLEILMDCTTSERIANNILDAIPNYIEKVLDEGEQSIDVSLIKGVGEAYNHAYCRELLEKFKYYGLMKKHKEYKLDTNDCKALYGQFEEMCEIDKAIQKSPYMVNITTLKRSFNYADSLILESRPELIDSEQRCEYCILDILERNEHDGSTRLNGNVAYTIMKQDYNVPELLPLVAKVCKNSDKIYFDEKSKDLSIASTYMGEVNIKTFIDCKLSNSTELNIKWENYTNVNGFKMTDKQSELLSNFCKYNFNLLVGYSGSGKTTSIKGLISLMEDNGLTYTLLAPTGKASMRMSEATNRRASTIHRKVLKDGQINSDVIIVDECSMIDLGTFNMLLNAIDNKNCRMVLVGDNAQLMPVGIGCIFNDIINSKKVPMVMLTEIFRYSSSGSLYVATNVRQGKSFFYNDDDIVKRDKNIVKIGNNYKFIQSNNILETVVEEYMKLIKKGVKPKDILCLSPFNVGDEGSYTINNAIQEIINVPKPNELILSREIGNKKIVFRDGDKLLNKKNDYTILPYESWKMIQDDEDNILSESDVPLTSIFNGQDGIIRSIDEKHIVAQFEEELVVLDRTKLNNLLLAYCISVHSSQGSEAEYVINVVSPSHERMLNRNLLYVADTRSKKMQIDIGDMGAYNKALLIDGNKERNTWLKELLLED